MKATEIIESTFTEKQIEVIKATINHGFWGDMEESMASGETKYGNGYLTEDAKRGLDLSPTQIAGIYSGIAKKIKEHEFWFMNHVADYWGEGKTSDGMLFLSDEVIPELEEWAKK